MSAVRGARPNDVFTSAPASRAAATSAATSRARSALVVNDAATRSAWGEAGRRSALIYQRTHEAADTLFRTPGAKVGSARGGWKTARKETRDPSGELTVLETARRRGAEVVYLRRERVGDRVYERTYVIGRDGNTRTVATRQWPRASGGVDRPPDGKSLQSLANRGQATVREEVFRHRGEGLYHRARVRDERGVSTESNSYASGPAGTLRLPKEALGLVRGDREAVVHSRTFDVTPRGGGKAQGGRELVVHQGDLRLARVAPSGDRRGYQQVERQVATAYQALKVFEGGGDVSEQVERSAHGDVLSERVRYRGTGADGRPVSADAEVETEFGPDGVVKGRTVQSTDSDLARTRQRYSRTEAEGPRGPEVVEVVEAELNLPGEEGRWTYRRELRSRLTSAGWRLVGTREELVTPQGERVSADLDDGGARLRVGQAQLLLNDPASRAELARLPRGLQALVAQVLDGVAGLMKQHAEANARRSGAAEWNRLLTRTLLVEFSAKLLKSARASAAPATRLAATASALLAAISQLNASAGDTVVVRPARWRSPLAGASAGEQVVRLGPYELLQKLGTGGMGEVFLARKTQDTSGRLLVVKRLLPHLVEDPLQLSRFLDEARIVAQLDHPNIVSVHDLGFCGNTWYLVMEHVDGPDLRRVVKRARTLAQPVPVGVACRIVVEVARALDHAHGARDLGGRPLEIVHRDVSPHNVMVAYDGAVKLIDFGVAKLAGERAARTQTGALSGKLPYMSPEQVSGGKVDARSDLFSLGVVCWELLAGRRLFAADSPAVTLNLLSECDVQPPSRHRPELTGALDRVVLGALRKEPSARWGTAGAFADALAPFAASSAALREYLLVLFPPDEERPSGWLQAVGAAASAVS